MSSPQSISTTAATLERSSLEVMAAAFERRLAGLSPSQIVATARRTLGKGRLALVSSFGTESAALLKIVADVDRSIPVLFLDTGWLFEETLAYRDEVTRQLGLTDVRTISPSSALRRDAQRDLWHSNPDACCRLRKIEPLQWALAAFDGWINGRKRYHGGARAALPLVEVDGPRLKFNPLAGATRDQIVAVFRDADLPRHPLEARGFASIGCMPCTSRAEPGEALRTGRWRGRGKIECGIHPELNAATVGPDDRIGP
ncbi:MAG TPA: phosphoadenylyl-sulfate reductase [Xanthobacteraceae bacterium]|nr:phosphoadenylyl-sulfate reductase [Xanthobacteraceae bacterium]